jgi:hypothetical protein
MELNLGKTESLSFEQLLANYQPDVRGNESRR